MTSTVLCVIVNNADGSEDTAVDGARNIVNSYDDGDLALLTQRAEVRAFRSRIFVFDLWRPKEETWR